MASTMGVRAAPRDGNFNDDVGKHQEGTRDLCDGVCDRPQQLSLLHWRGDWYGRGEDSLTTLLHVLASADEQSFSTARFETLLDVVLECVKDADGTKPTGSSNGPAPFVLVPLYDSNCNTPLDAALNVGNWTKAVLLAKAYVASADHSANTIGTSLLVEGAPAVPPAQENAEENAGACRSTASARWPWPHLGIARWTKRLAKDRPSRLRFLLIAATQEPDRHPAHFSTTGKDNLPRFLTERDYKHDWQERDWHDTFDMKLDKRSKDGVLSSLRSGVRSVCVAKDDDLKKKKKGEAIGA
jgi:hypothetical protein